VKNKASQGATIRIRLTVAPWLYCEDEYWMDYTAFSATRVRGCAPALCYCNSQSGCD